MTAHPQGRGETHAAETGPRLETATLIAARGMEAGGPGAPTPPAALHVEVAPEREPALVTTHPHHVEAHVQETKHKHPTATPFPAPAGTAAPTTMTLTAALKTINAALVRETVITTRTVLAH